ncbi:MAG: type II toxin-antitoxin system VapC family toxin [Proteobacteria bacterium]|nr:type II toxin-antitoxin system VapC family toxin [Pseudomonadota bacterium]
MGGSGLIFLDTCALLWNAFEKKSLSAEAKKRIQGADGLLISSISIWEIGINIKRGKLSISLQLEGFVSNLHETDNCLILPVDEKTWIDSLNLDWNYRDPADRVIVASSQARDIELITSDSTILSYYPKALW